METYSKCREHLFDELHLLDLRLNLQIARRREKPGHRNFNEFRGLFLSEEEVDALLGRSETKSGEELAEANSEIQSLRSSVKELHDRIVEKTNSTIEEGLSLPLVELQRLFQLSPLEVQTLLVCLAPEMDRKYEKLYAYLQNDVTRKGPSVDLILDVFCNSLEERVLGRSRFYAAAPLFKNVLLHFTGETPYEQPTLIARSLKLDDRIVDFLLDVENLDNALIPFARLITPRARLADVLLPAELKDSLARLVRTQAGQPAPSRFRLFLFHGPAGVGRKFTAEALCNSAGMRLLLCDVGQVVSRGSGDSELFPRIFREARLQSAAVYLDRAEGLFAENERAALVRGELSSVLRDFSGMTFLATEQRKNVAAELETGLFISVPFAVPDRSMRKQLWEQLLGNDGQKSATEANLTAVANKFVFTFGQIRHAASEALTLSSTRNHDLKEISLGDLYQACHSQSITHLSLFAQKIIPLYGWEDLIVPADSRQQLQEICSHVNYQQRVFDEWHFHEKISLGKGVSALFTGAPGTGKTMAAEIIAKELRLDLYKVDLSCIVDKYIGETEKNLGRIFREAEQSNTVLFFDEADAIFGKRSQVKDSHDRYANIEINYLLQRMEAHEGIVIMASNFQKNIDEAFLRRLRFVIDFPFPDEEHRYRIWERVFPYGMPINEDIDFEFLAKRFKIAGGNIKNIALAAAFLAAGESGTVTMANIVRATRREFQKMGRLCLKSDFDEYYELVEKEEAKQVGETG